MTGSDSESNCKFLGFWDVRATDVSSLEDVKALLEERKSLLPEDPGSHPDEGEEHPDQQMVLDGSDTEEEGQNPGAKSSNGRSSIRKRKREQMEQKPPKTDADVKALKQAKQSAKLVKEIEKKEEGIRECEEEIATLDNDLREADCPRTRVLGRDRFWNRYYWFERNGMPYGGLPNSSTAEAGYANGCIWVQGPDDLERFGFIEMPWEWQDEYRAKFNMTVPERKAMEEGDTQVFTAGQWGYYDDPQSLHDLMHYLDTRGVNEMKLKKELLTYRERIVEHMQKRAAYLNPPDDKSEDSVKARVSTRQQREHPEQPAYRCLAWTNTMALQELGHLHSAEPRVSKRQTKKGVAVPKTIIVEPVAPMKMRSEGKNHRGASGARTTRQRGRV